MLYNVHLIIFAHPHHFWCRQFVFGVEFAAYFCATCNMLVGPISVIDFEGSPRSGVLEYGVVVLKQGKIESCYSRLCAAKGSIGRDEWAVHKISSNDLKAALPFAQAWELFADLRQIGPFCAHNACVENGFLRAQWPYPRTSPNFASRAEPPYLEVADWGPWLDTLPMYKKCYPALESYKLEQLIDAFGLRDSLAKLGLMHCPAGRNRYHCALFDALASALLLQQILNAFDSISMAQIMGLSGHSHAEDGPQQMNLFT